MADPKDAALSVEREKFEAWARERLSLEKAAGTYYWNSTQSAWTGWQARAALAQAAPIAQAEAVGVLDDALKALNGAVSVYDIELADKARNGLNRLRAALSTSTPEVKEPRRTHAELMAMFGADFTSDADVGREAGCCAVCFDIRGCVETLQCKANLSPLTRIAPAVHDKDATNKDAA